MTWNPRPHGARTSSSGRSQPRAPVTPDADGSDLPPSDGPQIAPLLSIVIPTRDERDNIEPLIAAFEAAAPPGPFEVVFVDDSDDGTDQVVAEVRRRTGNELHLVHRLAGKRSGGLGGAVVEGLRISRAPWVCVMDADLQHPPDTIRRLLDRAHRLGGRPCDRESILRRRRGGGVRAPAPIALADLDHHREDRLSRPAPARHRPDERFLPGASQCRRHRRCCVRWASRSSSRSSSARARCVSRRCHSSSGSVIPAGARLRCERQRAMRNSCGGCADGRSPDASGASPRSVRPGSSSTRCCSLSLPRTWGSTTSSRRSSRRRARRCGTTSSRSGGCSGGDATAAERRIAWGCSSPSTTRRWCSGSRCCTCSPAWPGSTT